MQEPGSVVGVIECEMFSEESEIAMGDGACEWLEMNGKASRLGTLLVKAFGWKSAENDVGGYEIN